MSWLNIGFLLIKTTLIFVLHKTELNDLSHIADDGTVIFLRTNEVGKFRMMFRYQCHLRAKNLLPQDMEAFRFNSITRKDCISLVKHPDSIALISSACDITTTSPVNNWLVDNLKATYSPTESFKKHVKREASLFTILKDVKHLYTWLMNTLDTSRL